MSSAEKAKELIESFAETIPPIIIGNLMERDWITAKQCALISVCEILSIPSQMTLGEYGLWYKMYWKQVKEKILTFKTNYGKS